MRLITGADEAVSLGIDCDAIKSLMETIFLVF